MVGCTEKYVSEGVAGCGGGCRRVVAGWGWSSKKGFWEGLDLGPEDPYTCMKVDQMYENEHFFGVISFLKHCILGPKMLIYPGLRGPFFGSWYAMGGSRWKHLLTVITLFPESDCILSF